MLFIFNYDEINIILDDLVSLYKIIFLFDQHEKLTFVFLLFSCM